MHPAAYFVVSCEFYGTSCGIVVGILACGSRDRSAKGKEGPTQQNTYSSMPLLYNSLVETSEFQCQISDVRFPRYDFNVPTLNFRVPELDVGTWKYAVRIRKLADSTGLSDKSPVVTRAISFSKGKITWVGVG